MTNKAELEIAAKIIRAGGVVIFPTETVYGIGADALNAEALELIYRFKNRPRNNPLIAHIADFDQLSQLTRANLSKSVKALVDGLWPGPLTLVLPAKSELPKNLTAGLKTVAVRMLMNPTARELVRLAGVPIAAPSANLSGKPSSTSLKQVQANFPDAVLIQPELDLSRFDLTTQPFILRGQEPKLGLESTVVDPQKSQILRLGAITKERLLELTGQQFTFADPKTTPAPASPGMAFRHYAPEARMLLIPYSDSQLVGLEKLLIEHKSKTGKALLLESSLLRKAKRDFSELLEGWVIFDLGPKSDLAKVAKRLYHNLFLLDKEEIEFCLCSLLPEAALGAVINERLNRAAQK